MKTIYLILMVIDVLLAFRFARTDSPFWALAMIACGYYFWTRYEEAADGSN